MMRFNQKLGFLLPLAGVLLLFILFKLQPVTSGQIRRGPRPAPASQSAQGGLEFRLSEGKEAQDRPPQVPTPAAQPLSTSETAALVGRLAPIKIEPDDAKDFALRERSLPPPRTGQTINETFPPTGTGPQAEKPSTAPLEISRIAPEGEVPLAPHLSITFSQPMVAVTSNDDLAAGQIPVRLSPQPEGRWRWLGTKTLLFAPKNRFPMATVYTVEIPAGTKSAWGNALAATKRWTFSTPPPQVTDSYPNGGPTTRNPLFFVGFDQRINPAAVLRTIKLTAAGRTTALRLAKPEEIEKDEAVRQRVKAAQPERWLAFRAAAESEQALLADTSYTVQVGPGTPSAEGPRTTEKPHTFTFRTYGPLTLTEHRCGYQARCEPFMPWSLQFSNPLDAEAFDKKWFRVEPEVPGLQISHYGNIVNLQGATKGRTTYRVTIDAGVRDQFGQTLGKPVVVTFTTTDAQPNFFASSQDMVVLDPYAAPKFSIYSVNHQQLKVTLFAVTPPDWGTFTNVLRREQGEQVTAPTTIGRVVSSKVIDLNAKPDELTETQLDLSPALTSGVGHVVIRVDALQPARTRWERRRLNVWATATQIGLDAFIDQNAVLGWATSLKDGKPLSDVELTLIENGATAKTGADGLARLPLSDNKPAPMLIARRGNDSAFLPENFYAFREGGWRKQPLRDALAWHVFDDRGLYKPGEEVHVKGWLRRIGGGPLGDVGAAGISAVSYTLNDSRGNEITKGTLNVNALGGFDTKLKLPPTMNLGPAQLRLMASNNGQPGNALAGNESYHAIQVQEFRRPEYEVNVSADAGPHFIKGKAELTVAANYYAGGGLPNAEVNWNVNATATNYTPPNRGDFSFGTWVPWWEYRGEGGQTNSQNYQGRTDAAGKHHLRIDFDSAAPPRPMSVTASASVQDVNRQALSGATALLVHPAELYVGLRSRRTFVQPGEPLVVEGIVTDLDGKAISNREIRMRAVQLAWTFEKGAWKQTEQDAQECVVRSANEAVQCRFTPKEGGTYRVTAAIIDDRERPNQSELTLWVAGGKRPPSRELAQEKVELIPNQKEYKPGETAEILVQAPFANAEAVLTLRRSGLVSSERFTLSGASHTLRIPIKDGYTPNIHVQVELVGAAERTDDAGQPKAGVPKRPAFASGQLNLAVPPVTRKLTVTATPRDKALEPGGTTDVSVEVRDAAGQSVRGGEVALVVVDEAVLALTGYKLGDPLATFYQQRGAEVSEHRLREKVALANPEQLIGKISQGTYIDKATNEMRQYNSMRTESLANLGGLARRADAAMPPPKPMAMKMKAGDDQQPPPTQVRTNFDALAFFAAALPTDANGRATVTVKLPDNLTRYRVMAVAVAGEKQFGSGEAAITARLPLMARPSAPRFLNFGDRFELPVVVQNQTDAPLTVDVAVRASNATLLAFGVPPSGGSTSNATQPPEGGTPNAGRRVVVPANDRVEVRFPAAALKPGTARFQIGVSSGKWADAAEVSLPVWTPATTEAFATYGELDAGVLAQPVKAPSDAIKQFGGLEVTTSSTQLQALTDAVIYLTTYPYECAEQISSRVLAIAALRDVLAAFDAKGLPPADQLVAQVNRDVERLRGMQNPDGGFGFWTRGNESWPYLSIHVAHALARAKEKGFDVPTPMLEQSKGYLRNVEQRIPSWYSAEARRSVIAYALFTRLRLNDRDAAKARTLIAQAGGADKMPLESLGWLLPVLSSTAGGEANSKVEVAAIRRHLANRVEETAGNAHFTTSYGDGAYLLLHSDRRADGIILSALIGDDPTNDLIPKLARGLLAHRKAGRWENTQENGWVLLALDRYFNTYEKVTPDFVARVWLGAGFAGEQAFKGRTTDSRQLNIPMSYLMAQSGAQNLTLSKEGAGRLYYRIGMQYAPSNLQLKAADYGFTVTRTYEAVDDPNDVRRQEDGTWRIKAGAQVRVRLTMVAPTRRYHVALVDPLPAGFEALNPALATTGAIPRDPNESASNRYWWWNRTWYEHQNMLDERVEAFASLLWEGVHSYSYVARATTPGVFVVPPTKAEEMYHPETFGRGASERVVIE